MVPLLGLALCVLGLCVAEILTSSSLRALTKLGASTCFLWLAYSQGAMDSSYGTAVMVALVLSWIGDACLLSQKEPVFLGGIGAFLLGHIAYLAAFWQLGLNAMWTVASFFVLAGFAREVANWLGPKAGPEFALPVKAYIGVITLMSTLAIGAYGAGASWLLPAGAIAFFLSDLTVALDRFVEDRLVNKLVGLPLYYFAQALLALSVAGYA